MNHSRRECRLIVHGILLVGLLLCLLPEPVLAQSNYRLVLYPPDLAQFPKVTLFLDAYDAQGKFIPGLGLDSFTVFENGFERMVNEVQELEPGLHTILCFNLGATLSNRPNTSVPTRYEETVFFLASWLNALQSTATNQYSLISNEGILAENVQEKDTLTYRLQNYKPNLFNFEPDFSSLSLALDVAAKPGLIPNSKTALLYITPLPLDQELAKLPALQARARETGIPVHVWLVAPDTAVNAPAAQALNQLAADTGGRFFFFSEGADDPDPEDYVGSLRRLYRLRYTSSINQSGQHSVRVRATYGNQQADSQELPFTITLNLPNGVLVGLPNEVLRSYVEVGGSRELQPDVITLQARIEFPDGYDRQLRATRLYVDGEVVAENRQEPFTFFGWPLDGYAFSGEHLISVEVEDILGFRSISTPVAVMIMVASPYPAWIVTALKFMNRGGWVLLLLVGFGGSAMVVMRLRRHADLRAATYEQDLISAMDPLDQPLPGLESTLGVPQGSVNLPRREVSSAHPRLVWASSQAAPPGAQTILLASTETIIGSEPGGNGVCLEGLSLAPSHARLVMAESGTVTIADLGSEAGTWINFAPVSKAGAVLNHNDLVQIGSALYRFKLGGVED